MTEKIDWPHKYRPANCPVHVRHELATDLAPAKLWAWIVRADRWPTYWKPCGWVKLLKGGRELALGTTFQWKVMGAKLTSSVLEFEAPHRLAWDGRAFGFDAYHAWLLIPTEKGGCRLVSEETQCGWIARLFPKQVAPRLEQAHADWCAQIVKMATLGSPESLGAR